MPGYTTFFLIISDPILDNISLMEMFFLDIWTKSVELCKPSLPVLPGWGDELEYTLSCTSNLKVSLTCVWFKNVIYDVDLGVSMCLLYLLSLY